MSMSIEEIAAMMPLPQFIPITEAAKILGGGTHRIKTMMNAVLEGEISCWSHSTGQHALRKINKEIGQEAWMPDLTAETEPETVLVDSDEMLWMWCSAVERMRETADCDEDTHDDRTRALLQTLRSQAIALKVGALPAPAPEPNTTSHWPWGSHHTKQLGHLEAAALRFWVNYDPEDNTSMKTNREVAEWLQNERGVAANTANAIASILRLDGLPTGPRK